MSIELPILWGERSLNESAIVLDASEGGIKMEVSREIPINSQITIEFTASCQQRGSWVGADPLALGMGGPLEQSVIIHGSVCHQEKAKEGKWIIGINLKDDPITSSLSLLHEYLQDQGYQRSA